MEGVSHLANNRHTGVSQIKGTAAGLEHWHFFWFHTKQWTHKLWGKFLTHLVFVVRCYLSPDDGAMEDGAGCEWQAEQQHEMEEEWLLNDGEWKQKRLNLLLQRRRWRWWSPGLFSTSRTAADGSCIVAGTNKPSLISLLPYTLSKQSRHIASPRRDYSQSRSDLRMRDDDSVDIWATSTFSTAFTVLPSLTDVTWSWLL